MWYLRQKYREGTDGGFSGHLTLKEAEEFGKRTEGRAASYSEEKPEERDVIKAKRRENVEKKEVVMYKLCWKGGKVRAGMREASWGECKLERRMGASWESSVWMRMWR